MKNLDRIKNFRDNIKKGKFRIVVFGDDNYHFARKISNSRFGHMPAGIAYCETAQDVKECLHFCKKTETEKAIPFRIRSGGHHHEGMSSYSDALIIDLSKMYSAEIDYGKDLSHAWIPSGMKLEVVYNELANKGKIIPGGGCQSVSIGGLTQGGGWGSHIRKYGLTCDSLLDVEMVLPDGTILNTSNSALSPADKKEILWALRGGGGGNFGVVTKFKFALSEIAKVQSTFTIKWTGSAETIKKAVEYWVAMHRDSKLNQNLSCTASMHAVPVKQKNDTAISKVEARVAGRFYGTQEDLLVILKARFHEVLPLCDNQPLMEDAHPKAKNYFTSWNQKKNEVAESQNLSNGNYEVSGNSVTRKAAENQLLTNFISEAAENQFLTDFISGEDNVNFSMEAQAGNPGTETCNVCDKYLVRPKAPAITCDAPHPHKITSTYPINEAADKDLINNIYDELNGEIHCLDVRKYMVWHCLGGKMTDLELKKNSSFAYRDKPYMLQLQCWWDNSGQLESDEGRAKEYVEWVTDFRKSLEEKNLIEGAFINFVDKDLGFDYTKAQGKYDLLKVYYGDKLDRLIDVKKKCDPNNLFKFKMSIPTEKP
jgi:FAD/FMN-containing dehydrogenase